MKKTKNIYLYYWFIILSLLLIPITNGFIVNIAKITKSIKSNNDYKMALIKLKDENKALTSKLRYYNSSRGLKILVKDRLNKVEEGETLIKFDKPNYLMLKVN